MFKYVLEMKSDRPEFTELDEFKKKYNIQQYNIVQGSAVETYNIIKDLEIDSRFHKIIKDLEIDSRFHKYMRSLCMSHGKFYFNIKDECESIDADGTSFYDMLDINEIIIFTMDNKVISLHVDYDPNPEAIVIEAIGDIILGHDTRLVSLSKRIYQ